MHRHGDSHVHTSGRASNEAAFLYQLFVRAFGTNNLPDCSHILPVILMYTFWSYYVFRGKVRIGDGYR
ncbi:hypothetical protein EJA70_29095 [Pseudomonas sp. PB103]|nr:hypothetical protein EJA70_29095 [Pseudomonas sp. PB103]